jgi:hypothetical protein
MNNQFDQRLPLRAVTFPALAEELPRKNKVLLCLSTVHHLLEDNESSPQDHDDVEWYIGG